MINNNSEDIDIEKGVHLEGEIFEIKRLAEAKEKESQCYGGTFFANWFMVDCPILLHGLGFYGPEKAEKSLYQIQIKVVKVWGRKLSKDVTIRSEFFPNVEGRKGGMFQVNFEQPIEIPSNYWIKVLFDLGMGSSKTAKADFKNVRSRVTIKVDRSSMNMKDTSTASFCTNEVHFDFLVGSGQMPSIFASIP